MEKCFYVYVYLDPRTNPPEPFYVGKGHGKRLRAHLGYSHNKQVKGRIRNIRSSGHEPIVEQRGSFSDENLAFELEKELISLYGRKDQATGSLHNHTSGGEGTIGYRHRQETKDLFSEQRRGKPQTPAQLAANKARLVSSETREKMREASKGRRRHTPEQIEAIREHGRTRTITQAMRDGWSQTRRNHPNKALTLEKMRLGRVAAAERRKAAAKCDDAE